MKLLEIIQAEHSSIVINCYRGVSGRLAVAARNNKTLPLSRTGVNYWNYDIRNRGMWKAIDTGGDEDYGDEGGVIISTSIRVIVDGNWLIFPQGWAGAIEGGSMTGQFDLRIWRTLGYNSEQELNQDFHNRGMKLLPHTSDKTVAFPQVIAVRQKSGKLIDTWPTLSGIINFGPISNYTIAHDFGQE